jgi:hypothetical protein
MTEAWTEARAGRFSDSQWTVDIEPPTFSPGTPATGGSHKKHHVVATSPARVLACLHLCERWHTDPAPEACSCIGEAQPCHSLRSDDLLPRRPHDGLRRASAKNWQLAAFQVDELRGALARTIPNYQNINVVTAVASIFADKLVGRRRQSNRSGPVQPRQRGAA